MRRSDCFVSFSLSQSNVKSNQFALQPGLSRNVLFESNPTLRNDVGMRKGARLHANKMHALHNEHHKVSSS